MNYNRYARDFDFWMEISRNYLSGKAIKIQAMELEENNRIKMVERNLLLPAYGQAVDIETEEKAENPQGSAEAYSVKKYLTAAIFLGTDEAGKNIFSTGNGSLFAMDQMMCFVERENEARPVIKERLAPHPYIHLPSFFAERVVYHLERQGVKDISARPQN